MVVDHSSWQIQAIRLARFSFPHVYHNLARTVYYNIAIFLPPVLVRKTCPLFSRLFVRSNELEIEHTNWPRVWHVCGRFIRMYHYSLNMYIYMYFFFFSFKIFTSDTYASSLLNWQYLCSFHVAEFRTKIWTNDGKNVWCERMSGLGGMHMY